jgi:DNA-binding NarL/FixJ family response regulator
VIHRRQHLLGANVARALATGIANSRLVILDGSSSAPYLGDTEALFGTIEEFTATVGAPAGQGTGLTGREIEVLRLVAAGRSNREISEELSISINTVDRHVSNILVKIGASNRAEAASFAVRRRLA